MIIAKKSSKRYTHLPSLMCRILPNLVNSFLHPLRKWIVRFWWSFRMALVFDWNSKCAWSCTTFARIIFFWSWPTWRQIRCWSVVVGLCRPRTLPSFCIGIESFLDELAGSRLRLGSQECSSGFQGSQAMTAGQVRSVSSRRSLDRTYRYWKPLRSRFWL